MDVPGRPLRYDSAMNPERRTLLKGLALAGIAPLVGCAHTVPANSVPRTLTAAASRSRVVPEPYPDTSVWSYDGAVPGPELRFRQGDRLRVLVDNRLPLETTVHWHGIRLPNPMDGVPHVTQPPIASGGQFLYDFDLPDAGTYWYHPHARSHEQVARGLYGALIVEERQPPRVDRDVTWVLSDWRLTPEAAVRDDFDSLFDLSHAGRIGNTVTVNGRYTVKEGGFAVRSGERLRIRLINAAAARVFALRFDAHEPIVIATDGHAVEPHAAGIMVLGPGMRADVVLDCTRNPGARHAVLDEFYPRVGPVSIIALQYTEEGPVRTDAREALPRLPAPALPEPDLARAERHVVELEGGAMGRLREAMLAGERLSLARLAREHGVVWAINGVAMKDHAHAHAPLLTLARGAHCMLTMKNDTAWHHPMHLHGHVFRVLARNGRSVRYREWRDTTLLDPGETVDIAFVADNPGEWMFHCHVLDHQHAGMMATIRVA